MRFAVLRIAVARRDVLRLRPLLLFLLFLPVLLLVVPGLLLGKPLLSFLESFCPYLLCTCHSLHFPLLIAEPTANLLLLLLGLSLQSLQIIVLLFFTF